MAPKLWGSPIEQHNNQSLSVSELRSDSIKSTLSGTNLETSYESEKILNLNF